MKCFKRVFISAVLGCRAKERTLLTVECLLVHPRVAATPKGRVCTIWHFVALFVTFSDPALHIVRPAASHITFQGSKSGDHNKQTNKAATTWTCLIPNTGIKHVHRSLQCSNWFWNVIIQRGVYITVVRQNDKIPLWFQKKKKKTKHLLYFKSHFVSNNSLLFIFCSGVNI